LTGISRGAFQNAYMGYYIDQKHNGKGYATAAVVASRQVFSTKKQPQTEIFFPVRVVVEIKKILPKSRRKTFLMVQGNPCPIGLGECREAI
jgi:hypothetical protein